MLSYYAYSQNGVVENMGIIALEYGLVFAAFCFDLWQSRQITKDVFRFKLNQHFGRSLQLLKLTARWGVGKLGIFGIVRCFTHLKTAITMRQF